jgi:hypothetical protein
LLLILPSGAFWFETFYGRKEGRMRSVGLFLILTAIPSPALVAQEHHKILEQDDAPVSIRKYEPQSWGTGNHATDGVHHRLRFRNDTDRIVVAVKLGALCYNVFNEFQEGSESIVVKDILPGKRESDVIITYHDDPNAFLTGLTYVAKVRFIDGEAWEADSDDLDAQIIAFEDRLKRRKKDGGSRAP